MVKAIKTGALIALVIYAAGSIGQYIGGQDVRFVPAETYKAKLEAAQ